MDDLEQKLKAGLLEDLIEHMSHGMGERMKPKGMAVQVAAPDEAKLAEGLDKAKGILGKMPEEGSDEEESSESPSEESDEERLMKLLEGEEDDEDMKK